MVNLVKKNGSTGPYQFTQLGRLSNVAPGINPTDVTTVSQTMLITPTQTVTQLTSLTTGVTLNATKGLITTISATIAALGASTFTVTNSSASATSHNDVYIVDYAGTVLTNGVPAVYTRNRTATGFDIVITNSHATNALSGILTIGFEIKA